MHTILIAFDFCWNCNVFRSRRAQETRLAQRNAGIGINPMIEINAGTLLLIPVSLAVAFLLWVLWNLWRDEKRRTSFAEGSMGSRILRGSEKQHVEVGRLSLHR
jgi:hypothetical protein